MAKLFSNFNDILPGNPLSALVGEYGALSNPTGAWDKFKNGDTNEVNQNIANQNLNFQRENLDYQKALQQKIFDREDSAYARTVTDMRNAGLSPLTLSSTNGAGEAIQTEALHNDYQHQGAGFGDLINYAFQLNRSKQDAQVNNATISNLNSQTKNVDAQTAAQNTQNEFLPASLAVNLLGNILQNKNLSEQTSNLVAQRGLTMLKTLEQSYQNSILKNQVADSNRWESYASQFGISSNMTEKERYYRFAKTLFNDDSDYDSDGNFNPKGFRGVIEHWLENRETPETYISPEIDKKIDDFFENLGRKLDDKYSKHGFRVWKWF